jgi:predicted RNA binding protein YcfA (HicA-like mRNA interferase family)
MPKSASGDEVIKLLSKHFGFIFVSQKGSHVKLKKQSADRTIVTIVPRHRELAIGTLRGVLELAQIDFKEFQDLL